MRVIKIMKFVGALTALATAVNAYAANSGFYVGVDGGRDSGTIKTADNSTVYSTYLDNANNADGILWGVHAGYNLFLTNQFLLGVEGFWNRSNARVGWEHSNPYGSRDMQIDDSIGASILPGLQLDSNNRLYTRLGWIRSQFTQNNNNPILYGPSFSNKNSNGLELGLGYLFALANQWDLRMEYDHVDYSDIKNNVGSSSYNYKPQFNNYTLGIDYNFDSAKISLPQTIILPTKGWYTGIDVGYNDLNLDLFATDGSITYQEERSIRGYIGGAHVGYDWQLPHNWLIGVEGFGLANSSVDDYYVVEGSSQSTSKIREKYSLGVSILPGYQINNANLLYTRIGYVNSKFTSVGPANGLTGSDFSTNKRGLQLGLGYQVAFANSWSVFGEYDYIDYAEIHTTDTSNNIYNYDPEDNQYRFGINYHF